MTIEKAIHYLCCGMKIHTDNLTKDQIDFLLSTYMGMLEIYNDSIDKWLKARPGVWFKQ